MPRRLVTIIDEETGSATAVDVSELDDSGNSGGNGSLSLETPTGARDGVNTQFVFVGTPVLVMRNGVIYSPTAYSIVGTTVTITVPPADGEITGLTST